MIGLWNAVFSLTCFFLLLFLLGNDWYQLVLIFSYLTSTVQSHFTQRRFVWESSGSYWRELVKFSYGVIAQYMANAILLSFLVEILDFKPVVAQPLLAFVIAVSGYFYYKKLVFKEAKI